MLFLLQEGPAQTVNYFIAGYAVIFGAMGLYLVSLIVRRRNLKRDLETLEELQESKA
jgi:CcmD family protein